MQNATSSYLIIKQLAGHSAPHLDALQLFIVNHIQIFTDLWTSLWWMIAFVLVYRLWCEYREQNPKEKRAR